MTTHQAASNLMLVTLWVVSPACDGIFGPMGFSLDAGNSNTVPIELRIDANTVSGAIPLEVKLNAVVSEEIPKAAIYEWQFGDGTSTHQIAPSHTYVDSGTHEVVLTIRDGENVVAQATITVSALAANPSIVTVSPAPKMLLVSESRSIPLDGSFTIVIDDSVSTSGTIAERLRSSLLSHANVTATVRTATDAFLEYPVVTDHPLRTVFLLLKDDQRLRNFLESSGERAADYDASIRGNGFGQGYVIFHRGGHIFVIAERADGLFYGVVTLSDVFRQLTNSIPGLFVADYPDLERRIYYPLGHENLSNLADPTQGLELIEQMAQAKLNGVHLSSGSMLSNFRNMFAPYIRSATDRFIRPILGPSLPADLACAVEGFRVAEEPFVLVSNEAVPVREHAPGFVNLDFSSGDEGMAPPGWVQSSASTQNGEWKLRDTSAIGGTMSAALTRDSSHLDSRPMLQQTRAVVPGTWMLAEFRLRTEDTTGDGGYQVLIGRMNASGKLLSYRQEVVSGAGDGVWQTVSLHLSPRSDSDRMTIWIRPAAKARGSIYVDEVKLTRMNRALANVLLGHGHAFRVTDTTTGALYQEDMDYMMTRTGSAPTTVTDIQTLSSAIALHRLPGGSMPTDASVFVSFDYLYEQDKSTHRNMSPFVDCGYEKIRESYSLLAQKMTAEGLRPENVDVFLGQDEIRGFNQDARSTVPNLDNASALSLHINRLASSVRASFPEARLYLWADMFDRHHNGGTEDYQAWWGGKFGMTMPATFSLPLNVTLIPWWYDTSDPQKVIRESARTFNRQNIRVAGGPGGNLENIQYWSAMLHNTPNDFYGHSIFDASLTKEEAITAFGAYAWRNYSGSLRTIASSMELCNVSDDDGDGEVDEDYDLLNDADHCGACGRACDIANGWGKCVAGACAVAGCLVGFQDFDGAVDNGCEVEK